MIFVLIRIYSFLISMILINYDGNKLRRCETYSVGGVETMKVAGGTPFLCPYSMERIGLDPKLAARNLNGNSEDRVEMPAQGFVCNATCYYNRN